MTYCNSTDCPYTDCERHLEQLTKQDKGTFVKYEAECRKYMGWLAYHNYHKYVELKGDKENNNGKN